MPVQVTYVLRALRPTLDSLFPAHDSLARAECSSVKGLVCHQYVYRREPLELRASGSRLFIDTRLAYRARIATPGVGRLLGCGYGSEPMRRASLSMATTLYWRRDWRIGAEKTALDARLIDPCLVSVFGVDATNTLQGVINAQLSRFAASADTAIPRAADFKPLADSLWRSFLEPTALDSLGSLWLVLEPEAIRVAPFTGTGASVTTAIVLYARPRVVSGARPSIRQRPLPALVAGEAGRDFDVPVTVELPFADVEQRARALLAAETATGSVRVDSVRVRARGDTVRVELGVRGTLRGTLALESRLRWDPGSRELLLDDLRWSLESEGMLARAKATLAAPLVSRAVRRATFGGRIPLGAQLDSVRGELLRKLNGAVAPGVVLGSSVTAVEITGVSSSATAFLVRARLRGQAGVWIQ